MSGSYKATGINLKGVAIGESDRLLTILTKEQGLVRAVAPGARKHQSTLRGRSELFVVNRLLIVQGRSLDKVIQAESLESFPGLSQDLRKLTAAQYVVEVVLGQALSHQPQEELFNALCEHLHRLEQTPAAETLAVLTHAVFHLLKLAGVAPEVHRCCVSQEPLTPNFADPQWRIGFHAGVGGTVTLPVLDRLMGKRPNRTNCDLVDADQINSQPAVLEFPNLAENRGQWVASPEAAIASSHQVSESPVRYRVRSAPRSKSGAGEPVVKLDAIELFLLQQLSQLDWLNLETAWVSATLPSRTTWQNSAETPSIPQHVWLSLEKTLRCYAQYHLERSIQSASLIDTCFSAQP